MSYREIATVLLAAIGVAFMLVSAIGILRLPDVFSRMHAAGKASTVGVGCILISAGLYFWSEHLLLRMLVLICLIFATAPISTTAMARAAYRTGSARRLHLKHDEMAASEPEEPASDDEPTVVANQQV